MKEGWAPTNLLETRFRGHPEVEVAASDMCQAAASTGELSGQGQKNRPKEAGPSDRQPRAEQAAGHNATPSMELPVEIETTFSHKARRLPLAGLWTPPLEWVLVVGPCAGRGMVGAGSWRNTKGSEAGGGPAESWHGVPRMCLTQQSSTRRKTAQGWRPTACGLAPGPLLATRSSLPVCCASVQ